MKLLRFFIPAIALISFVYAQQRQAETPSWAPKPVALPKYTAPHKPHTKLSALKEKYKGKTDWREEIASDDLLHADYIYSKPGTKVSKRFHPDNREWWIVMAGQIRFDIEGQDSFVAVKGSMVQVPMQTVYSMETIGNEPSLRLEVNIAKVKTLYPGTETPPKLPGFDFVPVTLNRRPPGYDRTNKPHINLFELAKQEKYNGSRFVHDDRGVSNIIYGYEKNLQPFDPKFKGHYHPEGSEFWLIMTGQISYNIEGQPFFVAEEGDVVYVPPFTYHSARFHGAGPSCRLAINGYPNIAHLYEATAPH